MLCFNFPIVQTKTLRPREFDWPVCLVRVQLNLLGQETDSHARKFKAQPKRANVLTGKTGLLSLERPTFRPLRASTRKTHPAHQPAAVTKRTPGEEDCAGRTHSPASSYPPSPARCPRLACTWGGRRASARGGERASARGDAAAARTQGRTDARTHARSPLTLPLHIGLSLSDPCGCSPELQMAPRKLKSAASKRPFPLAQEDATGMPAASHRYCYADSRTPRVRLRVGRHSAEDAAEARGSDVCPAPWAATDFSLNLCWR